MQQKRLLLALLLSSAILFLWSYFYPAPSPPKNAQPGSTPSPSASTAAAQQPTGSNPAPSTQPVQVANLNAAPKRTITIDTPLYVAKFDTQGAEPVSWIIEKNKNSGTLIYSVAGTKEDKKPLELISPEGLKRQPRLVPLQLHTGDAALDSVLTSATYRVEGVDKTDGDVEIDLVEGQKKELTFVFEDANHVQVRKTIIFDAD